MFILKLATLHHTIFCPHVPFPIVHTITESFCEISISNLNYSSLHFFVFCGSSTEGKVRPKFTKTLCYGEDSYERDVKTKNEKKWSSQFWNEHSFSLARFELLPQDKNAITATGSKKCFPSLAHKVPFDLWKGCTITIGHVSHSYRLLAHFMIARACNLVAMSHHP